MSGCEAASSAGTRCLPDDEAPASTASASQATVANVPVSDGELSSSAAQPSRGPRLLSRSRPFPQKAHLDADLHLRRPALAWDDGRYPLRGRDQPLASGDVLFGYKHLGPAPEALGVLDRVMRGEGMILKGAIIIHGVGYRKPGGHCVTLRTTDENGEPREEFEVHQQFFEDFAAWEYDEPPPPPPPLTLATWQYVPEHVLPRWGQGDPDRDLASLSLPAEGLRYPVLVDRLLRCKVCRRREHVQFLRHHPGACGAFATSANGIDCDWRWTCCGRHESLSHGRACQPSGGHAATGCVEAPLCVACHRCPCVALIARREEQMEEAARDW